MVLSRSSSWEILCSYLYFAQTASLKTPFASGDHQAYAWRPPTAPPPPTTSIWFCATATDLNSLIFHQPHHKHRRLYRLESRASSPPRILPSILGVSRPVITIHSRNPRLGEPTRPLSSSSPHLSLSSSRARAPSHPSHPIRLQPFCHNGTAVLRSR
jgi:hypothetical protein